MPPALPDDPRMLGATAAAVPLGNAGSGNANSPNSVASSSGSSASGAPHENDSVGRLYNDENVPPANLVQGQSANLGVARGRPRGPEFDSDESSSDASLPTYDDGRGGGGGGGASLAGEGKSEGPNGLDNDRRSEAWRSRIIVGSALDVLDTVRKWSEAEVVAVDPIGHRVKITYTYWGHQYDDWFPIASSRLAPPGTRTYQSGGDLMQGHRIDVFDPTLTKWREAEVVEESAQSVRVRFARLPGARQNPPQDEWLSRDSERIRPYGREKEVFRQKRTNRRLASLAGPRQEHQRQITQLSQRYAHYLSALAKLGYDIHPVEGDGNCLFRSVSHQVYGDEKYHAIVRAKCMDYMESERHYFEPYVEGGMEDFLRYVNIKRQNAVWGDDPEVQALCELYDRAAEIWAYDPAEGAKMLRTFHEAGSSGGGGARGPPMRLSYYGGGHYDSIVSRHEPPAATNRLRRVPGAAEDEAIARSRLRVAGTPMPGRGMEEAKLRSDEEATERAALDLALQASRQDFDRQADDIEGALKASMEHIAEQEAASVDAAAKNSELIALQEQMLRFAQAQSEEEQLRRTLEASVAGAAGSPPGASSGQAAIASSSVAAPADDACDLAAAIRASLGGNASLEDADAELQHVLRLSAALAGPAATQRPDAQDPELAAALALSLQEQDGARGGDMAAALGEAAAFDEDELLSKAIEASLSRT